MDLYQLRYFLETARELNFSRAAENLHVTSSAVSRSIAQADLGCRPFLAVKPNACRIRGCNDTIGAGRRTI